MSKVEFRRLSAEDSQSISDRLRAYWLETYVEDGMYNEATIISIFEAWLLPDMIVASMNEGMIFEDVVLDGNVCGLIGFEKKDDAMHLDKLYLDAPVRGKGLGSFTLSYVEDCARDLGCTSVYMEAGERNYSAIMFYEAKGYTRMRMVNVEVEGKVLGRRFILEKQL